MLELTDDESAELAIMTKRIASAVRDTFDPNGIHVQQHNGVAAWQTIPHVHFPVIPVMAQDDWPPVDLIPATPSDQRQAEAPARALSQV